MGRLALLLLSVWTGTASAQSLPSRAEPFQVGRWYGKPFYDSGTSIFTHCSAHAAMGGGVSMAFVMNRHGDFSMVFGNPLWALEVGETWDTGIFDEGAENESLIARVIDRNLVAVQFGNDPGRYLPLIAWGELTIPLPGGPGRFTMPEGGVVARAVRECVVRGQNYNLRLRRHAAVRKRGAERLTAPPENPSCAPPDWLAVAGVEPGPEDETFEPATSAPGLELDRLLLEYVLESSVIGGVEILPDSLVKGQYPNADAAWVSGGVLGFAKRLPSGDTAVAARTGALENGVSCAGSLGVEAGLPLLGEHAPATRKGLSCHIEDTGVYYRAFLVIRPFETIAVAHCGDLEDRDEVRAVDDAMVGAVGELSAGWRPELGG